MPAEPCLGDALGVVHQQPFAERQNSSVDVHSVFVSDVKELNCVSLRYHCLQVLCPFEEVSVQAIGDVIVQRVSPNDDRGSTDSGRTAAAAEVMQDVCVAQLDFLVTAAPGEGSFDESVAHRHQAVPRHGTRISAGLKPVNLFRTIDANT
ncbi:hypothetical protein IFM61606_05005 [Aspergillus udagawae]|nr:hypothetical protein IFM61606_05005 [Aspergillus udagawae]